MFTYTLCHILHAYTHVILQTFFFILESVLRIKQNTKKGFWVM